MLYLPYQTNAQCWAKVSARYLHTLAIKTDGTLWAWGRNDNGQLGIGNTIDKNVPTQVGTDTDWKEIDSGGTNSMAQKVNGTLWAWGSNDYGQVGNGTFGFQNYVNVPTQIGTASDWINFDCAADHSYAIKSNGTLWGWGNNNSQSYSQLGTGDTTPHYTPFQIGTDTDWIEVSGNTYYALAIKSNHTLWGWGNNTFGALAIGLVNSQTIIPTQTGNATYDWLKVSVGGAYSTKILKLNGSLWAMGYNYDGNLGIGSTIEYSNTPVQVTTDTDWVDVSTNSCSVGLKSNGSAYIWGRNNEGQLGNGTNVSSSIPISILNPTIWFKITSGAFNTYGITQSKSLYAWGFNNYGQLGDGTNTNRNLTTLIGSSCNLNNQNFNNLALVSIVPNPIKYSAIINYNLNENESIILLLSNNLGQLLFSKELISINGTNYETIQLENYPKGIYYITLSSINQRETIKLIKQ